MIDLKPTIAVDKTTKAAASRLKTIRAIAGEKNPRLLTFRFDRVEPATLPVVPFVYPLVTAREESDRAKFNSVHQDTVPRLNPSRFNAIPWLLLTAFIVFVAVGFVAKPTEGHIAVFVAALVWFYILFCSESADSSNPLPGFFVRAQGAKDSPTGDAVGRTADMANTVSTAAWSLRPFSRRASTYSQLTSITPIRAALVSRNRNSWRKSRSAAPGIRYRFSEDRPLGCKAFFVLCRSRDWGFGLTDSSRRESSHGISNPRTPSLQSQRATFNLKALSGPRRASDRPSEHGRPPMAERLTRGR